MDTLFVCLANSYKHGNRCIAGVEIELDPETNTYSVKRDRCGNPIWFRPINQQTDAGAIPNAEALTLSVFDIVKAHQVVLCPEGAQTENYYYSRLEKISRISKSTRDLDEFVDNTHRTLFGNSGVAVHPDKYEELDYSVLMIKSSKVEFYQKDRSEWNKDPQPRGKLMYHGIWYDLPVTDPEFRQIIHNDIVKANSFSDYYITLSLGVEHEKWHSKLIAGVIGFNVASQANNTPCQDNVGNRNAAKEESAQITFNLFQQGSSIEEIAARRGLVPGAVGTHLVHFIESGELDVKRLVSDDKIHRVADYKRAHPEEDKLRPYFDAFNGEITFTEIRWILAAINGGQIR